HINTQYVLNAIPPEKDVDVLSEKTQGAFFVGRSAILPPAVETVKIIFSAIGGSALGGEGAFNLEGKNCAVFGYGLLVGKPVSHWLASQGATVSIINEFTSNPTELSHQADIIISGVGKPNLITADMVKEGVVVIDFGYNILPEAGSDKPEAMIVGDVDFNEVSQKAGWITPVPGGVGPIVIAAVLKNLLALYKK
ncbi:MAG: bifunctional 5,10-methylenetetrahydrofolate dehydrogenase/5,10-methenyltetrahydrofolate cyclohydrolase, partial [bacterium]|nr:bifunctional 5,10-methylenetetrahydrofolate dehydrogenase/5,10-methenyltetrahydrofolate cyclohydrolase [bacterium]